MTFLTVENPDPLPKGYCVIFHLVYNIYDDLVDMASLGLILMAMRNIIFRSSLVPHISASGSLILEASPGRLVLNLLLAVSTGFAWGEKSALFHKFWREIVWIRINHEIT